MQNIIGPGKPPIFTRKYQLKFNKFDIAVLHRYIVIQIYAVFTEVLIFK